MTLVLILSGPIAVGKSTLAVHLAGTIPATVISARRAIEELAQLNGASRTQLQVAGAAIDERTDGRWLGDYLLRSIGANEDVIVDSARTPKQVDHIRCVRPEAMFVHLNADPLVRAERYKAGQDFVKRSTTFDESMDHLTERVVQMIAPMADIVLETSNLTPGQVADAVRNELRAPRP